MNRFLITLAFVLVSAARIGAWPKENAVEPIHMSGVLGTKVFPGLPNYESVAKGDQPKDVWLLTSATVPPGTKGKKADYQLVVVDNVDATLTLLHQLMG